MIEHNKSAPDGKSKPTVNGRPRLSLPGFKTLPPAISRAIPFAARLPLPPGHVNMAGKRLEAALASGALRPREHASALHFLAIALAVGAAEIPSVFRSPHPLPLKVGVYADLRERFPLASPSALSTWLKYWTGTEQYLRTVAAGGYRFDLDGAPCGEIAEKDAAYACKRRDRAKKKPAAV